LGPIVSGYLVIQLLHVIELMVLILYIHLTLQLAE
jgi:hypothetical protein